MKTEGLITAIFRDKDTLEELRREEFTNTVVQHFDYRMQYGASVGQGNYSDGVPTNTNNRFPDMRGVGITSYRVKRNLITTSFANTTENFALLGQNLQAPVYYAAQGITPAYWEMKVRFQPHTSARTFWTIYLGNYAGAIYSYLYGLPTNDISYFMFAYAALDVPCTQQTTEVLDIYYRLRISDSAITPMTIVSTTNSTALRNQAEAYADIKNVFVSENRAGYPYREAVSYSPVLKTNEEYKSFAYFNEDVMDIVDVGNYRNRHSFSKTVSDDVGKIFGSYIVYGNDRQAVLQLKAAPTGFNNKPIQPIHNHNISAPYPFLDVSYLASGQGKMFASTSTWNSEENFPQYFRVDVNNTGEVGTSTYTYRKKATVGMNSGPSSLQYPGDYRSRNVRFPFISGSVETFRTPGAGDGTDNLYERIEEYSKNKFVMWEGSILTILDAINGDYKSFYNGSTPTLPVTSIYQVAVQDDGTLWVACAGTGLWKIADPLGTPVVTRMTSAVLPPGITDINAYAVEIGYNNSVWAIMNGGLVETTDSGATWTIYNETTPTIFNMPGVSNNLWGRARLLRIDRENPNSLMGILFNTNHGYSSAAISWWDKTGVTTAGLTPATSTIMGGLLTSDGGPARAGKFRCSRYGGLWGVVTRPMDSNFSYLGNGYAIKLFPRSTGYQVLAMFDTPFGNNRFSSVSGVVFGYDIYNNPYMIGYGGMTNDYNNNVLQTYALFGRVKRDGNVFGIADLTFSSSSYTNPPERGYVFTWEKEQNRNNLLLGWHKYDNGSTAADHYELIHMPGYTWSGAVNEAIPLAEMYWDHYRWDPTASLWKKNWNTPALDVSGNNFNGNRKGFRPERQQFTERSTVEATPALGAGGSDFTNQFTVATSFTPASPTFYAWPTSRSPAQVLLDLGRNYTINGASMGCLTFTTASGSALYLDRTPDYNVSNRYVITGTLGNGTYPVEYSRWNYGHWWSNNGSPPWLANNNTVYFTHHRCDVGEGDTGPSNVSVYTNTVTHLSTAKSFDIEFTRYVRWNTSVQTVGTYNDSATEQAHYIYIIFGWPTNSYGSSDGMPTIGTSYIRVRIPQHAAGTSGAIHPRFACQGPTGTTTSADTQFQTITNNTVADDYKFNTRWILSMVWNVDGSYTGTLKTLRADDTLTTIGSFTTTSRWTTRTAGNVIHLSQGRGTGTTDGSLLRYGNVPIKDMWLGGMQVTNFKDDGGADIVASGDYVDVQCYRDGGLTISKKVPTTAGAQLFDRVLIGAEQYKGDLQTSWTTDNFLAGSLGNFQLWNVAWDATDAINDAADPTGMILSKPATNMRLRYLFTDSLVGLESKPTHTATELIDADIAVRFQNGATAPAFVAPDYYTFGVCDGIMKDNAISFSYYYDTIHKPIIFDMSDTPQVTVPATTSVVTEPIYWRNPSNVYYRHGTADASPNGSQITVANRNRSWGSYYGANGFQRLDGDGSVEVAIGSIPAIFAFGLDTSTGDTLYYQNFLYTWMVGASGTTAPVSTGASSGSQVMTGTTILAAGSTVALGDIMKIERIGTTVRFYHNGVVKHTVTGASTASLYIRLNMYGEATNLYDCNVTYTRPAGWVDLGNPTTLTGKYARGYVFTEPTDGSNFSISVDGVVVPAKRYDYNSQMGLYTPPGVGEVLVIPYGGIAILNAADYGKTITALKYASIYDK